jgi:cytochrome P450
MSETTLLDQVFAQENRHDPYPLFAELRKTPVARQPDGTFVVSGYEQIVTLLHDPRVSSDPSKRGLPGGNMRPGFINTDPPNHDRLRREATSFFGPPHRPDRVASLEPWMHETVNRLIDDLVDKKRIDVVEDVAYPFPVSAICRVLGVPREDEPKFHAWSGILIQALGARFHPEGQEEVFQKALTANQELSDYLAALAEAHRKDPGDDLLSGLVTDEGPDRMDDEDIPSTARLLLIAGHETTVNLIGTGTLLLLVHPDQLALLRADPARLPLAIEEFLRFDGPVMLGPLRYTSEDVQIGAVRIPAGQIVLLSIGAANRDPARFDRPDAMDVMRIGNPHVGFGHGIHFCLGSALARVEGQIAIGSLIRRFPDLALAVSADVLPRRRTLVRGLETLPVSFTPPREVTHANGPPHDKRGMYT